MVTSKKVIYDGCLKQMQMVIEGIIERLLALIAAIIILSRIERVDQFFKKHPLTTVILAISFVALSFGLYGVQEDKNAATSTGGTISSSVTYPLVNVGNNHLQTDPTSGIIPFEADGFFDPIYVKLENGYIKVSATVRDEDGKYLAGITDNNWDTTIPPTILDKNFDKNAFEVVDSYKKVVLQVNFVGKYANISGIFYGRNGSAMVLSNGGMEIGPATLIIPDKTHNIIEPIFVYPSKNHLGERVKK